MFFSLCRRCAASSWRQPPRRFRTTLSQASSTSSGEAFKVSGMALGRRLDLRSLYKDIPEHGLYTIVPLAPEVGAAALMATAREEYTVMGRRRDIVLFENGAVVLWNMSDKETQLAVDFFRRYAIDAYLSSETVEQCEELRCKLYQGNSTKVIGEEVHLPAGRDPQSLAMDKYALSDALATSARLGHLESQLDSLARDLEPWIASLQDNKKVYVPGDLIISRTGQLYQLRYASNMSDGLADQPDLYWEYQELESLYTRLSNALNVSQRSRLLNTKLQFCLDLCELFRSQKHELEAHRLEKIIIVLITIEILFGLVHMAIELRAH